MVAETTVRPAPTRPLNGVVEGIGGFSEHLLALSTLQAKLAAADVRESAARTRPAVIAVGLGVPIGLASATLLLAGFALEIAAVTGMSLVAALVLTGLVGAGLCGSLLVFAVKHVAKSLESFRRSREELERNLAWVRTVLLHSGR